METTMFGGPKKDWSKIQPSSPWPRIKSPSHRSLGLHWYAVHCAGASDARVESVLEKIKYEIYVPKCLELRAIPKRELTGSQRNSLVPIQRPTPVALFPRYPLLRFDLDDPLRYEAFKLLGVRGLICDGASAAPLPAYIDDIVIDRLRRRESGGALPAGTTIRHIIFELGEVVRINVGVFAGHNATVEEALDVPIEKLDERTRIKLLVCLFGRDNPVEIAITDISKL